jgi:hypothetical protein
MWNKVVMAKFEVVFQHLIEGVSKTRKALVLIIKHKDRGSMFLQNVAELLPDYAVSLSEDSLL